MQKTVCSVDVSDSDDVFAVLFIDLIKKRARIDKL